MHARKATLVVLAAIAMSGEAENAAARRREKMTAGEVVEHVKRKDWDVVEQPGLFGPDAVPALVPLLQDPDTQIRELTVHCLGAAGGPEASKALLSALNDRIETVSAAAVREFSRHYSPQDIPAIRKQMAVNSNEYVRQQLALLLGKTDDKSNIPVLEERKKPERSEHARHAITLALARLGEEASRNEIKSQLLQDANVGARAGALRDLPYVNDRSLLAEARPLLDDTRNGMNVGPAHTPVYIRVCDVVVLVADEMLNHPFSFPVSRRRYSAGELEEAKRVLSQPL